MGSSVKSHRIITNLISSTFWWLESHLLSVRLSEPLFDPRASHLPDTANPGDGPGSRHRNVPPQKRQAGGPNQLLTEGFPRSSRCLSRATHPTSFTPPFLGNVRTRTHVTHSEELEEAPRRTERDESHAIRNRGYPPPRYDGDDGRLPEVRSINGLYRDGHRDSKDSTRMKNTKLHSKM